MVADDPICPPPPRRQPSPYSDQSVGKQRTDDSWRDLAEQRGQLLHDMTDKWAERRVAFLTDKRMMGERIGELAVRERTLTYRIKDLERTLLRLNTMLGDELTVVPIVTIAQMKRMIVEMLPFLESKDNNHGQ